MKFNLNALFFIVLLNFFILNAKEKDMGAIIVDQEPHQKSWVYENNVWKLFLRFDKVWISIYFPQKPKPVSFLGLSPENKPIKAEASFLGQAPIILTEASFEAFETGEYSWILETKNIFSRLNEKFDSMIIEVRDNPYNNSCYCDYWLKKQNY